MANSSTRERALSEDVIVKAALRLIRRKGVAALTMRDLAETLGVSPMAAYYYVESKDDLLRLVGNHVYGSIELPPPSSGLWYERLRSLVIAERDAIKPYRGLHEELLYRDVEPKRSVEDAQLDLILEAGFPSAKAVPAYRTLRSWIMGNAFFESALRDPKRRPPPSRWPKAQRLTFDREQMPEMHADDYFLIGLDTVIEGMRAMLEH
jgi:AcrR family transcriptional regulator